MRKFFFLKFMDFVFVCFSIGAIIFSMLGLTKKTEKEALLYVTSPDKEFVYPLSENIELRVEGELGISVIRIEDGNAFFVESPCPNHICSDTPPLRANNDWAACIPNNIFIRIEGGKEFNPEDYISNDTGE